MTDKTNPENTPDLDDLIAEITAAAAVLCEKQDAHAACVERRHEAWKLEFKAHREELVARQKFDEAVDAFRAAAPNGDWVKQAAEKAAKETQEVSNE